MGTLNKRNCTFLKRWLENLFKNVTKRSKELFWDKSV